MLSSPDIEFRSFGAGDPKGNFVTVIRMSRPSTKKIKNDFIWSTFHFVRTRMIQCLKEVAFTKRMKILDMLPEEQHMNTEGNSQLFN